MIKVELVDMWGFEHSIRGMRNSYNSWDKSDSEWRIYTPEYPHLSEAKYEIGKNDLDLMKRLYKLSVKTNNPAQRKFMRQIFVSMDVTAPLYWWKEMDQYKVGTVTDSCSTMHTIHSKPFTLSDFSCGHLNYASLDMLNRLIGMLNVYREDYLESKDKSDWWQMIQLLPSSYNQKRTLTMSYENVVSIINQREGHRLDEWNDFVKRLKELPYIKEITDAD